MSKYSKAYQYGYRSGLEKTVSDQLNEKKKKFKYEELKIKFEQPAKKRTYSPDFLLKKKVGGIMFVETKGRFLTADRQKHLMVRECHPDLDIRFVFSRSKTTISKVSKTTYANWCDQHGFKYADKLIPQRWLDEVE